MAQATEQSQGTQLAKSKNSTLKMPDGEGGFSVLPINPTVKAYRNKEFFTAFGHMLLTTRKTGNWNTDYEAGLLKQAMKRHAVTVQEAYDAFWDAYSDQYTPASGIEWRHLWKHIEKNRYGSDRKLYTYREMLNICDRESITTDHFEYSPEESSKENPNKSADELRVWRRR